MSDNFIPLTQSTPVQQKWIHGRNQHQRHQNSRNLSGYRRGGYNNKWANGSRNSFGSNSSNNSYGQDRSGPSIDAYLHPSMLQDPWASLRQTNQFTSNS